MAQRLIDEQEISLREIFQEFGRCKWICLTLIVLFVAAAFLIARALPKRYEAQVIVAPSDNSTSPGGGAGAGGGMSSQLGGLASLAGLSGGDSKRWESLAVLQSQSLTEDYIRRENLLPLLYRTSWDGARKAWKNPDPHAAPTLWKASMLFKSSIRSVSTDAKTGLSTLKITWTDPLQAAKWANDLVKMTNDVLREKAIALSERNIAYLSAQAKVTDALGVKQAIFSIMESEINKEMLAKGNDEYALKVLDPAFVPERVASPDPVIWTAVGAILGVAAAFLVVLARLNWNKR